MNLLHAEQQDFALLTRLKRDTLKDSSIRVLLRNEASALKRSHFAQPSLVGQVAKDSWY